MNPTAYKKLHESAFKTMWGWRGKPDGEADARFEKVYGVIQQWLDIINETSLSNSSDEPMTSLTIAKVYCSFDEVMGQSFFSPSKELVMRLIFLAVFLES